MANLPRRKPPLFVLIVFVWVTAVFLYINRNYLSDPLYWLGFLVYGLFGGSIAGIKRPALLKISGIVVVLVLSISYAIAVRHPETWTFIAGYAGFFTGIGIRIIIRPGQMPSAQGNASSEFGKPPES